MTDHKTLVHADHEKAKKLLRSYVFGFVLTIVLTLAAYFVVQQHMLVTQSLFMALTIFVVLYLLIQVVFFLRLSAGNIDDRWNLIVFLFTILIMAIVVSGSLWIMYNLNYYMVH